MHRVPDGVWPTSEGEALRQEKAIEQMTFEDWRLITGIILDGAFHCVKACLGAIKKSDAGSAESTGASHLAK